MREPIQSELIQKACDLVDGQTALARELTRMTGTHVTQQRVRNWIARGDEVPTDFMAPIEILTHRQVTRKQFRPNDWHVIWPELVDSPADGLPGGGPPDIPPIPERRKALQK